MTYQEVNDRLSKVQQALKSIQSGNLSKKPNNKMHETIAKLQAIEESLSNKLKVLAEQQTGTVATDDEMEAEKLAKKGINVKLTKEQEGVKFTKEETAAIAREVGKGVAKALHSLGDEIAHMKAKDIEENSFEIYVQYKKDTADDTFSFYISDDTLHLVDFSFDKELVDVGVKPSGEAIVHVDVLANALIKHFKSLQEGMSDQEYADAKEADRLEKHPEKDTIKKIQALIAAQQKKEDASPEQEEKFHKKLDTLVHKTFGKRKEELEEASKGTFYIKVAVRDARKALSLIDDSPAYSKAVEISGSDTYYLTDEELAHDLLMDFGVHDIEVTDSNIEDGDNNQDNLPAIDRMYNSDAWVQAQRDMLENEAEDQGGDLDIGHQDDEPDMLKQYAYDIASYAAKLYKQLDKYDKMDAEVDFPNWWQSKVILAREYISKAQHYLEFEEKQPAIDQLALEENLNEEATCCGKCGRVHVKGTGCKKPYLTGKNHCRTK